MTDIMVKVVRATGLMAADSNGFSDPYCILTAGRQKKKTKIIKMNLEPVWNEGFVIDIGDVEEFLVEVYDHDVMSKDDFLGQVIVPLHGLRIDGQEHFYPLTPGESGIQVTGELVLIFKDPPAKGAKLAPSVINDIKTRIRSVMSEQGEHLNLSAVGLFRIPKAVTDNLTYLTSIDISFNEFEEWPELEGFVNLRVLDLSGNRLVKVADAVSVLTSLENLMLNGNQIKFMAPGIGCCTKLEKLNLANNRLVMLPAQIGRLQRLEELNLGGNPLFDLPIEIGECASMEVMDLSCGALEQLPEQFCYMLNLMELNLGNNRLFELPSSIGRMSRLCVLNISDNQLQDLPMSLGHCISLGKLGAGINLDRNPITNEELLAKWKIGTDHLVDYLEKRMNMTGTRRIDDFQRSRINEGAEFVVRERSEHDMEEHRRAAGAHRVRGVTQHQQNQLAGVPMHQQHFMQQQQQMRALYELQQQQEHPHIYGGQQQQQQQQQGGYGMDGGVSYLQQQQQPLAAPSVTLDQKLIVLKQWGNNTIQLEFKPAMTTLKFSIQNAHSIQDCVIYADIIKNLKPELTQAKSMCPPFASPPPPAVSELDDKLTQLRATLDVAINDCIMTVNALQGALQLSMATDDITAFVRLVKAIKTKLDASKTRK